GAAMKIVRAGLHDVIEKAAADLSVFRREVARQNGDFLKGIHAWLNLRLGRGYLAITRVLTFESIRSRVAGSAVDLDRGVRDNVSAGQELRHRSRIPNAGTARGRADRQHGESIDGIGPDVV